MSRIQKIFDNFVSLVIIALVTVALFDICFGQTKYKLPSTRGVDTLSLKIARSQIGVKEKTNRNDGKEVEEYLRSVGLGKGLPYCYAFQYWAFQKAADSLKEANPLPKSGLANSVFNLAKKKGEKLSYTPKPGNLIVWRYARKANGHIERIDSVFRGGWVHTIAANTSSGKKGSQDNGNGVWGRYRNIYVSLGLMEIRGLVGFSEEM